MKKLRDNSSGILWVMALSFGVVWTLQDSEVFSNRDRGVPKIALVNGEPITNRKFQRTVGAQMDILRNEVEGGVGGRMQKKVREQVYDKLVESTLIEQKINELGLNITDQEVENMVFGENPHPAVRSQFGDSTGAVDYDLIRNLAKNPDYSEAWKKLEEVLKRDRRSKRFNSLIESGTLISEKDVKDVYLKKHRTASIRYFYRRYADMPRDSVSITEEELHRRYNKSKEEYRRGKILHLNAVTISKTPSKADSAAIKQDLINSHDQFLKAKNDSLFLEGNASRRGYKNFYRTPTQLETAIADSIYKGLGDRRIVGPVIADGYAHLIKIRDYKKVDQEYAHLSQILLRGVNHRKNRVKDQLLSFKDSIREGHNSFSQLAGKYSEHRSASEGGNLGWKETSSLPKPISTRIHQVEDNTIIGPIEFEKNFYLIRVHQRASKTVQIAELAYKIEPGQATLSSIESNIEDFRYYAKENSFLQEAGERGYEIQSINVAEGQKHVPGVGRNRALEAFLESAETGDISQVIETARNFALLTVSRVKPAGVRPFSEVKNQVRSKVVKEKKEKMVVRYIKKALKESGVSGLSDVPKLNKEKKTGVSFGGKNVTGVGADPHFFGTVFGLKEGEMSRVIKGSNAAFVVYLDSLHEPSSPTDSLRASIRDSLLQERTEFVRTQWLSKLKEKATIKDRRGRLY